MQDLFLPFPSLGDHVIPDQFMLWAMFSWCTPYPLTPTTILKFYLFILYPYNLLFIISGNGRTPMGIIKNELSRCLMIKHFLLYLGLLPRDCQSTSDTPYSHCYVSHKLPNCLIYSEGIGQSHGGSLVVGLDSLRSCETS